MASILRDHPGAETTLVAASDEEEQDEYGGATTGHQRAMARVDGKNMKKMTCGAMRQ
jgi:hypothetical protein